MSKEWPNFPVGQEGLSVEGARGVFTGLTSNERSANMTLQEMNAYNLQVCKGLSNTPMRQFATGATRNTDDGKIDPEGFMSPIVILRYCAYMNRNRVQADGQVRASDNWAKGISQDAYAKSLWRHTLDVWLLHRGYKAVDPNTDEEEALCAVIFNAMGKLHEILLKRDVK